MTHLLAGFDRHPVDGLHSIAHLVPAGKRCGVYVLTFRNGDRYVGQASDVTARFGAHRRAYPDEIVDIAFRPVRRTRLDEAEQREIARLHRAGVPLRNVVHMPGRLDATAFDELISRDEQKTWLLSGRALPSGDGHDRPHQPELRARMSARAHRLAADPRFAALVPVLRRYIGWTVPFPGRTELSYWAVSALPSTNAQSWPRLFTLSVQQLETLFACAPKDRPDAPYIVLNVDAAVLAEASGGLKAFARRHRDDVDVRDGWYASRPGVVTLTTRSAGAAHRILDVRGVTEAARRLNLDLMRKGATSHWRTHCFGLADHAFAPRSLAVAA